MIILIIALVIWLAPVLGLCVLLVPEYGLKTVLPGALLWPLTLAAVLIDRLKS